MWLLKNLGARKNEDDDGKNVGKMLCAREWEAIWEVSWPQGQRCAQKGVFCPLRRALIGCSLLLALASSLISHRESLAKPLQR